MSASERFRFFPALCICILAVWWRFDDWTVFFPGVVAFSAAVIRRRWTLDTVGQLIVALFLGAMVYAVFFWWQPSDATMTGRTGVIGQMGCVFCIALFSVRMWIQNPVGGTVVSAMILFVCWLFLGVDASAQWYLYLCAPGVVVILWDSGAGNGIRKRGTRSIALVALMLMLAAGIGAGFIVGIPQAYNWMENRLFERLAFSTTGFSSALKLGSVNRMFVSNQIVFRVFGKRKGPTHLRGVVYNTWNGRYWTNSIHPKAVAGNSAGAFPGNPAMDVRMTSEQHRLFVPLNTKEVSAPSAVALDSLGIAVLTGDDTITRYGIKLAGAGVPQRVLPPVAEDSDVPESLRAPLMDWMSRYIEDGLNPAQRLAQIQATLQSEYRYSLTFTRAENGDALVDFLTRTPEGHCEYFASAFALLARVVGVPARVIGGYYLKEYNPMGDYYIVREKNAHVWTEVWLNGRWMTMDPTPSAALAENSSIYGNMTDSIWVGVQRVMDHMLQLKPWVVVSVIGGLLLFWGGIVWQRRHRRNVSSLDDALAYGAAHHLLVQLEQRFADRLPRGQSEPVEDWAHRLAAHDQALHNEATLLLDYAAWRYGRIGDIDRIVERAVQLKM